MEDNIVKGIKKIINDNYRTLSNKTELSEESLKNLIIHDIYTNSEYFKDLFNYLEIIENNGGDLLIRHQEYNNIKGLQNTRLKESFFYNDYDELTSDIRFNIKKSYFSDKKKSYIDSFNKILIESENFQDLYKKIQLEPKDFIEVIYEEIEEDYNKNILSILTETFPFEEEKLNHERKYLVFFNDSSNYRFDSLTIRDFFFYDLNNFINLEKEEMYNKIIEDFSTSFLSKNLKYVLAKRNEEALSRDSNIEAVTHLVDNIIKNPYLYKQSIIYSLLENNTKESRCLDLYNRFLFKNLKNKTIQKIKEINSSSIKELYKENEEVINILRNKILENYSFLNKSPDEIDYKVKFNQNPSKFGEIIDEKSYFLNPYNSVDEYNCIKGLPSLEFNFATMNCSYEKYNFYAENDFDIIGIIKAYGPANNKDSKYITIHGFEIADNFNNKKNIINEITDKVLEYCHKKNKFIILDFVRDEENFIYYKNLLEEKINSNKKFKDIIVIHTKQENFYQREFFRNLTNYKLREDNEISRLSKKDINKFKLFINEISQEIIKKCSNKDDSLNSKNYYDIIDNLEKHIRQPNRKIKAR